MAVWALKSYSLNSKIYAPLETAILQNMVMKNTSRTSFQVTKVLLQFDCQEGFQYSAKCNITLNPNQTVQLPGIEFTIPLGMPTGSQRYTVGAEIKQFLKSKWEINEAFGGIR